MYAHTYAHTRSSSDSRSSRSPPAFPLSIRYKRTLHASGYILDMALTPYRYTSPYDPDREDDGLFGPHSVTWRIMSSRIMWVAVLRALYLQAYHPRVIRGTLQNAATITEPVDAWARLRRTRTFIETRTFGTTAEAERAGRRVRKIHDPLTGTDPDGTRYRVGEPD